MKLTFFIPALLLLFLTPPVLAAGQADGELSPRETEMLTKCNIEARNSLISGDLKLVKDVCLQAVSDMEKSKRDEKMMIDPIMNLAFSYTLAGQFENAKPFYERARKIAVKVYGSDSKKLRDIDKRIRANEEMQNKNR